MINKIYLNNTEQKLIIMAYKNGEDLQKIANKIHAPISIVNNYIKDNGYEGKKFKYANEVHGHIQYANYYGLYEHQYVMMKELKIQIKDIKKYIVHHLNEDKQMNYITNLWLFWDRAIHKVYHAMLERGEIGQTVDDLYLFTKEYMYNILADIQRDRQECVMFSNKEFDDIEKDVTTYIKLVDKLYKKQKKILAGDQTS